MKIKFYDNIFGPVGLYESLGERYESRDPEAMLKEGEVIGNLVNKRQCGLIALDLSLLNPSDIPNFRNFTYQALKEAGTAEFLFYEKISAWVNAAREVGFFGWPSVTADGLFTSLDEYFKWQKFYKDSEISEV